jgi:hypothetical protein
LGGRFSKNAAVPSRLSREEAHCQRRIGADHVQYLFRASNQFIRRDDLVHQTDAMGLIGINRLYRLNHLQRSTLSLAQPAEQRLRLLLVGMAQAGLGHKADAAIALMSGDIEEAHRRSSRLIELTGCTAERTWQSIAWETKARVLLSEGALIEAVSCLDRARQIIHGFEASLAEWRILSTAAATHSRLGEHALVAKYSELGRLTRDRLTASLPQKHWLRGSLARDSQMEPLLNAEIVSISAN